MKTQKGVEPMFTTNEAAAMLGVTAGRVRQMIVSGAIAAEKRGRDLMIPQSQIEKAKGRQKLPGRPKKGSKKAAK